MENLYSRDLTNCSNVHGSRDVENSTNSVRLLRCGVIEDSSDCEDCSWCYDIHDSNNCHECSHLIRCDDQIEMKYMVDDNQVDEEEYLCAKRALRTISIWQAWYDERNEHQDPIDIEVVAEAIFVETYEKYLTKEECLTIANQL